MPSQPTHASPATRIDVQAASGRYAIDIQPGVAERLPSILESVVTPKRRFVISTANIWRLHGRVVAKATSEDPILIGDGERYKTLQTVGRIYDLLVAARNLWSVVPDFEDETERRDATRLTFRLVHLADIEAVTAAA